MEIIRTWRTIRPKSKEEWKHFLLITGEVILGGIGGYVLIWLGCALTA